MTLSQTRLTFGNMATIEEDVQFLHDRVEQAKASEHYYGRLPSWEASQSRALLIANDLLMRHERTVAAVVADLEQSLKVSETVKIGERLSLTLSYLDVCRMFGVEPAQWAVELRDSHRLINPQAAPTVPPWVQTETERHSRWPRLFGKRS